jgi:hypothetical protein
VTALAIGALRLYEIGSLPVITGDAVRNLLYGVAVREWGVTAAGRPLADLSPDWLGVSWAHLPYNYPPLALAFFSLVAAISPTVFAAKFALTLVEAANAWLVSRVGESRALGLVYWASPASMWWVSREGQFEPLQSLFALAALAALPVSPLAAGVSLALAVQVKVTAVFLAPWLAHRAWRAGPRALGLVALGLALGLLPSTYAELRWSGVTNVLRFSAPLRYNPYFWSWTANVFSWNPGWLIFLDELASYSMLAALVTYSVRRRSAWSTAAPILFVVFCKSHSNVQFWYWLLLAPLLLPIEDRRWRFALVACVPLLDVSSTVSLLGTPIGEHGFRGADSVWFRYQVPRSADQSLEESPQIGSHFAGGPLRVVGARADERGLHDGAQDEVRERVDVALRGPGAEHVRDREPRARAEVLRVDLAPLLPADDRGAVDEQDALALRLTRGE